MNQATFNPSSTACGPRASSRNVFPVPDGPHTTRFSRRCTHSRVRSACWVGAGIEETSGCHASKVFPVGAEEQVILVHVGEDGPVAVARHHRATPGTPRIDEAHFPPQPEGPLDRRPRAKNAAESEFLDLGEGARLWLVEAAAAGTSRMRVKMAEALALAKLFDPVEVDWALGHAAVHGRFAEADLSSILDHHARAPKAGEHRASEDSSLTQGTSAWARLGQQVVQQSAADTDEVIA